MMHTKRYFDGNSSTWIGGGVYVWNSTNWVLSVSEPQYGLSDVACGLVMCYATAIPSLARFDPLSSNATLRQYSFVPNPPSSITAWQGGLSGALFVRRISYPHLVLRSLLFRSTLIPSKDTFGC
jgi:hypothetical protein